MSTTNVRESKDEAEAVNNKTAAEAFKHLLVAKGEGAGGASGDLLARLEDAITRGDHKVASVLAKELAKLKISSRLTEQESGDSTVQPPVQYSIDSTVQSAKKCSPPVKLVK